jgi:ankyrin repeat protein
MATLISDERSLEQYIRDLVKTHQLTGNKFLEICAVPKLKKHCFNLMQNAGVDMFSVDENNQTALFKAAESGNLVLLRALLEQNLDPEHTDNFGETALMVALRCGNRSVAECLLKIACEDVKIIDNDGATLLHKAAWGNLPELANVLLLEHNMDIDSKDYAGRTALHVAAYQGNTRILKYLLEYAANVNAVDNEGRTPIFSGAYDGNFKTVKLLCEYGADLHLKDNSNLTVLEYAVSRKEFETAKFLNGKLGNIYPDLENMIRKHKSEQHSRAMELIKEISNINKKNDLPMP